MTPESFIAECAKNNIRIELANVSTLILCKNFEPGNKAQYTAAESEVGIIYSTPSVGAGSVWGTDGGSIGGYVGLTGGYMRLHKSNVARKFVSAVAKLLPR